MKQYLPLLLLVLSPVLVYGLLLVVVRFARPAERGVCPRCGERGLVMANFIKATVLINGQRAPDCWSYLLCEKCGGRLKDHRGEITDVTPDEWDNSAQPWLKNGEA